MSGKRVLVVEDDPAIRRGVVDALAFAGYSTLEAGDGPSGCRAAIAGECDLLLLDLVLPGRDGLDVLRDANGRTYALEVGDYFLDLDGRIAEWLFEKVPADLKQGMAKFKIPRFTRTVSQWLNLLVDSGFLVERVEEPRPSDATVQACPALQDAQIVAYFLHFRVRKPGRASGSRAGGRLRRVARRSPRPGRWCREHRRPWSSARPARRSSPTSTVA